MTNLGTLLIVSTFLREALIALTVIKRIIEQRIFILLAFYEIQQILWKDKMCMQI